jgi:hypothetical protein
VERALEGLDGVGQVRRDGDRFELECAADGPAPDDVVRVVASLVVMPRLRRALARRLGDSGRP